MIDPEFGFGLWWFPCCEVQREEEVMQSDLWDFLLQDDTEGTCLEGCEISLDGLSII